jgi:hypothetical protein
VDKLNNYFFFFKNFISVKFFSKYKFFFFIKNYFGSNQQLYFLVYKKLNQKYLVNFSKSLVEQPRFNFFFKKNFLNLNFFRGWYFCFSLFLNFFENKFKNNYYFFFLNYCSKKNINFKKLNVKVEHYFNFINYFFKNFFEFFLKCRVELNFKNFNNYLNSVFSNDFIFFLKNKFKRYQFSIGRGFFLFETIEVIWITFFLKDSFFFLNWLIKTAERIPYKNFRKFLSFLRFVFTKVFTKLIAFLGCRGFYFDVRGKVGVAGNAKKRHFSFFYKKYSLSNKNLKINFFQKQLKTYTGALGFTFFLTF